MGGEFRETKNDIAVPVSQPDNIKSIPEVWLYLSKILLLETARAL